MPSFIDLSNTKFGRLFVQQRGDDAVNTYGRPVVQWLCLCDCGVLKLVRGSKLKSGHTSSCGCLQRETTSRTMKTHGKRSSRAYNSWSGMKNRCLNHKTKKFYLWGGRGIAICKLWIDSFEAFYAYMGDPPPKSTLDRIDNNKGYEPGNVRWATPIEQSNNLRTTKKYDLNGESKTLTELAKLFDCSRDAIKSRLKRGQTIEDIAKTFKYI